MDNSLLLPHRYEQASSELADVKARLNNATTLITTLMRREERLKLHGKEVLDRFRTAVHDCLEEDDVRNNTPVGKLAALKKAIRKCLAI